MYLLGDIVFVQFALVRHALDILATRGVHAGDPAGARPRGGDVRHRVPAHRRRATSTSRSEDDLYLVGTAEVPLAAFHMGEILDEADLPLRLRRVLDVLPPRGRHVRQGHGRHVPRAPVRQGGDVQLRDAGGRHGTSTSSSSAIEEEIVGEPRAARTGW